MRVIWDYNNKVRYGDLFIGDCFVLDERLYMKTNQCKDGFEMSVSLETGVMLHEAYIDLDTMVYKVTAVVTISVDKE